MRHLRTIVNLIAVVLIVLATIRLSARRSPPRAEAADSPSILSRRVGPLEFHGLAFDDAAERLGRAAGVEILIDDQSMEPVISTAVSLKTWDGMTLDAAPAAPVAGQSEVRYFVDRGRVRITIWPRIPVVTRIYDVHDIQRRIVSDFTPGGDVEVASPFPKRLRAGFYGGALYVPTPTTLTTQPMSQEEIERGATDDISRMVMLSSGHYDAYLVNGGRGADLRGVNGKLIIADTAEAHRKVSRLLSVLREMYDVPPPSGRGGK